MKSSRRILFVAVGFIFATVTLMGLAIAAQMHLVSMNSTSMEPSKPIKGASIHQGNLALVANALWEVRRRGALVVVSLNISGRQVTTIRRIAAVPGDHVPNTSKTNGLDTIPIGYYYLLGDSTNALDSRQLGPVAASQISGRVLFVLK
jgi:type IV secretory pathway protease TraF